MSLIENLWFYLNHFSFAWLVRLYYKGRFMSQCLKFKPLLYVIPACQILLNNKIDATARPGSHSLVLQWYNNQNVSLGENGPTVHRLQACRRYESHLMTWMTCLASSCFVPKIFLVFMWVVDLNTEMQLFKRRTNKWMKIVEKCLSVYLTKAFDVRMALFYWTKHS